MAQVGVIPVRPAHALQLADALSCYPNNLPLQLNTFIGRGRDAS